MTGVWMVLAGEGASGQTPSGAEGRIYWTEERDLGWLRRSDLDGAHVESLVTTDIAVELKMGRPWAIALDYSSGDKIYWTEWIHESGMGAIRRAGLDGSDVETLVTGLEVPFDLALDAFEHKMYWTDRQAGTVQRADLDGAGVETLVTGLEAPLDIALDIDWHAAHDPCPTCAGKAAKPAGHIPHDVGAPTRIFWTDGRAGTIQRSDLDGSNVEVIVEGTGSPAGLVAHSSVIWGEKETGTVREANLDGSDIEVVRTGEDVLRMGAAGEVLVDFTEDFFWRTWDEESKLGFIWKYGFPAIETEGRGDLIFYGGLYWTDTSGIHRDQTYGYQTYQEATVPERVYLGVEGPRGIALDVDRSKMYWVDKGRDAIRRADLDGTDVEDLITGVDDPEDIALDTAAARIYWTEGGTGAIRRADLDGGNVETVAASKLRRASPWMSPGTGSTGPPGAAAPRTQVSSSAPASTAPMSRPSPRA